MTWRALRLAGDGWRNYFQERATILVGALNSPRATNICDLYRKLAGVDLTEFFDPHVEHIDAFVSKRGEIAHRGANAGHVSIYNLDADYEFICRLVADLDNHLVGEVQAIAGHRPWNRRFV